MKKMNCDYEETVIESKMNDNLTAEQKEHIKNCSICTESLTIFQWMNKFDEISSKEPDKILPSPDKIWQHAVTPVSNQKDLIKKAMRPLVIAQFASYITVFIGIIFILLGKSSLISKLIENITKKSSLINSLSTLFDTFSKTLPFLIIPLGMVSFLMISYFVYSLINPENA